MPWQHDFAACTQLWWPGQRPVSVPKRVGDEISFVDWLRSYNSAETLFAALNDAGFVRFHPEDGGTYLDDLNEEMLVALLETGTPEALEARERLERMTHEGRLA